MARSLQQTIADAAALFPTRYTATYLSELERRSPFRFACLAAQCRRLSRANGSLTGLLESWIAEEEDWPLPSGEGQPVVRPRRRPATNSAASKSTPGVETEVRSRR